MDKFEIAGFFQAWGEAMINLTRYRAYQNHDVNLNRVYFHFKKSLERLASIDYTNYNPIHISLYNRILRWEPRAAYWSEVKVEFKYVEFDLIN